MEATMSEWKEVCLEDISSDVSYGYKASAVSNRIGPKFLRITDIQGGTVDWHNVPYCEIADNKIEQYRLSDGNIVVARTGNSTGENYLFRDVNEESVFASYLIRFTIDETIANPTYVWYNMRSPAWWSFVNASKTGSAQGGVNAKVFGNYCFHLPPLPVQKRIVSILGAFDDKIELNRQMNTTLEGMTQALFKSWFVDFDPVRAKTERRPTGLPSHIAKLFPKEFEESPLGPIPKGWKITSLGDQVIANKGLNYKGDHLCEPGEGVPMHNLNSVYEGGGYKYEGLKWYNGEYRPAHLLKPGDIIVTNTEQDFEHLLIGFAAIVPERYGSECIFSHHIFRLLPKTAESLPTWFIYLLLRIPVFHEIVAGYSNGTTVNMLPQDGLEKPKFVQPPCELVEHFENLFLPVQRRTEQIHDENISLFALRDTLLPKLLSGKLEV
jgi:type I restriction enzyme S subunit